MEPYTQPDDTLTAVAVSVLPSGPTVAAAPTRLGDGLVGGAALIAFAAAFAPWQMNAVNYGALYQHTYMLNAWGYWASIAASLAALLMVVFATINFLGLRLPTSWFPTPWLLYMSMGIFMLGGVVLTGLHVLQLHSQLAEVTISPGFGLYIGLVATLGLIIAAVTFRSK